MYGIKTLDDQIKTFRIKPGTTRLEAENMLAAKLGALRVLIAGAVIQVTDYDGVTENYAPTAHLRERLGL